MSVLPSRVTADTRQRPAFLVKPVFMPQAPSSSRSNRFEFFRCQVSPFTVIAAVDEAQIAAKSGFCSAALASSAIS